MNVLQNLLEQQESLPASFCNINIQTILELNDNLVDEAIMDMLKHLLALNPDQPQILGFCV